MMMSDLLTMLPPGALMMIVAAGLVLVPHHARQLVMLLAIAGSAFSLTRAPLGAPPCAPAGNRSRALVSELEAATSYRTRLLRA